jgi:hypothetical protein
MYIGFNDVRQTEIHTAEPQVLEPSAFEFEMAIEGLNRRKSPSIDQIPAEVITAGSIHSEIQKLINSVWIKEQLPEEWKESIIAPIYNKGDKRAYINYSGISLCQLCTKFYPTSCYCYVILLILYSPGVVKFWCWRCTWDIVFHFVTHYKLDWK